LQTALSWQCKASIMASKGQITKRPNFLCTATAAATAAAWAQGMPKVMPGAGRHSRDEDTP
jgi:hypothetical protein